MYLSSGAPRFARRKLSCASSIARKLCLKFCLIDIHSPHVNTRQIWHLRSDRPTFDRARRLHTTFDSINQVVKHASPRSSLTICYTALIVQASSFSTDNRYANGSFRSDSRLSTLYIVRKTTSDKPVPASSAVGTDKPAAMSKGPADSEAILSSHSATHRMRRPPSAFFRPPIVRSTHFDYISAT